MPSLEGSELVRELQKLRHQAGQPTLRMIVNGSGISEPTVSVVFSGKRATRWPAVRSAVTFLGGDCDRFLRLWEAATGRTYDANPHKPEPGTPLSEMERKVLNLLSYGDDEREIGRKLYRNSNTIKNHIRRIYARLQSRNRAHAVRLGFELGYLENSSENAENAA